MSDEDMIWVKDKGNAFSSAYITYSSHERLMIDKDQQITALRAELERKDAALREARGHLNREAQYYAIGSSDRERLVTAAQAAEAALTRAEGR